MQVGVFVFSNEHGLGVNLVTTKILSYLRCKNIKFDEIVLHICPYHATWFVRLQGKRNWKRRILILQWKLRSSRVKSSIEVDRSMLEATPPSFIMSPGKPKNKEYIIFFIWMKFSIISHTFMCIWMGICVWKN